MVRGFLRKFWRCDDGAALVEFTVIAPVIIVLFVGGAEFARIMTIHHAAEKAIRDVARYRARLPGKPTSADIVSLLKKNCDTALPVSKQRECELGMNPRDIVNVTATVDNARYAAGHLNLRASITFKVWLVTMVLPVSEYTIHVRHEQPCLDDAYNAELKTCK